MREKNRQRFAGSAVVTVMSLVIGLTGVRAGEKPPDPNDPRYWEDYGRHLIHDVVFNKLEQMCQGMSIAEQML